MTPLLRGFLGQTFDLAKPNPLCLSSMSVLNLLSFLERNGDLDRGRRVVASEMAGTRYPDECERDGDVGFESRRRQDDAMPDPQ